jgi:hypothetical protein
MANHHPSPQMAMQMHHGAPPGPPPPGAMHYSQAPSRNILSVNEHLWMQIGRCSNILRRRPRIVQPATDPPVQAVSLSCLAAWTMP